MKRIAGREGANGRAGAPKWIGTVLMCCSGAWYRAFAHVAGYWRKGLGLTKESGGAGLQEPGEDKELPIQIQQIQR